MNPVEIASYFEDTHLVHRSINGGNDITFGDGATQISKRWSTVGHETPPYKILVQSLASVRRR